MMGRASRARRVATAAAFGGGSLGALSAAAGRGDLRRVQAGPAPDRPGRDRPAPRRRHLVGARGQDEQPRRWCWRCSVTPRPPGTACTPTPTRRPPGSRSGCRRCPGGRSGCATWPWSAPSPRTWLGQVERVLAERPDLVVIMIGANDVTHRVRAVGIGPPPGRCAGAARPSTASRSWSAPARIWAPSVRSRSRCAGWPGGCRGRWPRPRRSRWWPPAAGRSASATSSARSSRPGGSTSPTTSSIRRRSATPAPPRCCCRRPPPRWA